jgi:hypothetical protein
VAWTADLPLSDHVDTPDTRCDRCGEPMTHYDEFGQWCDKPDCEADQQALVEADREMTEEARVQAREP